MKAGLFSLALVLCFTTNTMAQDLIVTDKGDSLNCKITKTKGEYIHFMYMYETEVRSTLLPNYRVIAYKMNYYLQPELPVDIARRSSSYPKFRVNLSGGYSHLIARISDNVPPFLRDYMKNLKSGYHFGADASFFISESIGFGLKYSMFKTRNEIGNVIFRDLATNTNKIGTIKDDITQHYFGPAFCTRFYSTSKNVAFLMSISMGYIDYTNNATQLENFTMTGNSLGMVFDFGADFMLAKNLALGVGLGCTLGTISSFRVSDGTTTITIKLDAENSENISRIDLGIGLKWYM